MYARVLVCGGPVEADARGEVVTVGMSVAAKERKHERVDVAGEAADVLHVRVEFVAEARVERESWAYAPVVLKERGDVRVVRVGDTQGACGDAASERDGEEQIVVVNVTVAVAVEVREVFDEFDAALLEDAETEAR